jgi:hypothetical protein
MLVKLLQKRKMGIQVTDRISENVIPVKAGFYFF